MTAQELIDYLKRFPAETEVQIAHPADNEYELTIESGGYVDAEPVLILEEKL